MFHLSIDKTVSLCILQLFLKLKIGVSHGILLSGLFDCNGSALYPPFGDHTSAQLSSAKKNHRKVTLTAERNINLSHTTGVSFYIAKPPSSLYNTTTMTIKDLLAQHIDTTDAEVLLAHLLKKDRSYLKTHDEEHVGLIIRWKFSRLAKKRKDGIPLAYLTGEKYFYGLRFVVNKDTLIPRPETELIVDDVIKMAKNNSLIVDIGTGSGCIPISIATNVQTTAIIATDISKEALKVAKQNAMNNTASVSFRHGSLAQPVLEDIAQAHKRNQPVIITANLPYLVPDHLSEPTIKYEPVSALVSDDIDGLELYRQLFAQLQTIENLSDTIVYCEINPEQRETLGHDIRNCWPEAQIDVLQDLQGLDRIVKCTIA